ncbi:MAG: winged helix-turn-helix domain-containing protein [Steroidobacteraceae bacterium]|nr:winged helix-turn-helix domain-containing protein [Steroidobacteraceae bacterium]
MKFGRAAPDTAPGLLLPGALSIDPVTGEVTGPGGREQLDPKVMQVLMALARRAGEVVSHEELFAEVWSGAVVTDDVLRRCIYQLREHLVRAGGDRRYRALLETLPKRGYRLRRAADAPRPAGALRRSAAIALAAALAAALALGWIIDSRRPDAPAPAVQPSIAVLPFADLSDAQDQQYFAEGLSEEILNLLAQIPDLRVIARTSSFAFRDQPELGVAAIARQLDVSHVLEGSVRKSGDRVRITAQLVDASDSRHLWSETYDREPRDLLAVQEDIASAIARTLEIRLVAGGEAAERRVDPGAYEHYLHGLYLRNRRGPGDLAAAERSFRVALEIDADYAPAWAALASVLMMRAFRESDGPTEGLERMREAVSRALALDPLLPEAQVRAAQYHFQTGDFERAREHWRRARELDPDHPLVLGMQGGLAIRRGDIGTALAVKRRIVMLDPVNATARNNLAWTLVRAGFDEEAERQLARAKELSPGNPTFDRIEAELMILQGRFDEALGVADRLAPGALREQILAIATYGLGQTAAAEAAVERMRRFDDFELPRRIAEIHAVRGEVDQAFEWLVAARDAELAAAATPGERSRPLNVIDSLLLRALHDDPRWTEIVPPQEIFL